ncbi:MAG: SDR family NAD(P)-dependent oxidoreductase [Deltaproteobacteria bacterium]|jgi:acyl transferase domain-containing protein/acyl carrier protein|nr:SDR family NAD(P)-dependent oxidoreductase [Deltaproteobacteria bacterium]
MKDLIYVFSGLGSQWAGMGADLIDSDQVFTEAFREFDSSFRACSGWSVEEKLFRSDEPVALSYAQFWHPAIVAVQYALYKACENRLPKPQAVLGHSGGEAAAALIAGALSLKEAACLTCGHIKLMEKTSPGALMHLPISFSAAKELTEGTSITVAAVNSPSSVVLAGDSGVLNDFLLTENLTGTARLVPFDRSFHSPALEPFGADFEKNLQIKPQKANFTFISSFLARIVPGEALTPAYWRRHAAEPVRFDKAVELSLYLGAKGFVDFSPHPIFLQALHETASLQGRNIFYVNLMQRHQKSLPVIASALTRLKEAGSKTFSSSGPQASEDRDGPENLLPPGASDPTLQADLELPGLNIHQRAAALEKFLVSKLHELTEIPDDRTGETALCPFMSLGLDSLNLVSLINDLALKTGLTLAPSLVFSYPEARSLARYSAEAMELPKSDSGETGCFLKSSAAQSSSDRRPEVKAGLTGREPLAVVGLAFRFPGGAVDGESFWRILKEGRDAIGIIPKSRWNAEDFYHPDREHPGTMYTRSGGFIEDTFQGFDANFFGLAGREAKQLDPQQRLLLELSWEAFEDGSIDPLKWKNKRAGVFLGMTNSEYSRAHRDSFDRDLIDAYSLTGTTMSGACGRLSYFYGFNGPCFTVDTACSSSLVALAQAGQSLRAGESDLALVGAVSLMLIPEMHICFTKLGAISSDGRSKAFDDGADGYGRGEGAAVVLLKRLGDAEKAGDRILGTIKGHYLNQDGRSNGLTAPSGLAQQELIKGSLADAGLLPSEIDYVEAHGTGTSLGDLVELEALSAAYGPGRLKPLLIGSVKANIGHLEPVSGLASLIKVLLAMKHGQIPANIHLKSPNRRFDWAKGRIAAPTSLVSWPDNESGALKRAGLSAFGFSGVNGHLIVEEYRRTESAASLKGQSADSVASEPPILLLLSAKSQKALEELAFKVAQRLRNCDRRAALNLAYSLANHRPHFEFRAALVGSSPSELADRLASIRVRKTRGPRPLGLLFTGQGSQCPGLGWELYKAYPVFQESLDSARKLLLPRGIDPISLINPDLPPEALTPTQISQPLICAVSLALYDLWTYVGLTFDSVLGHSVGEFPALAASGILDRRTAVDLVCQRGLLMAQAPDGSMTAVFASVAEIEPVLKDFPDVRIAADNAVSSVTLSGPADSLSRLSGYLEKEKISSVPLKVSAAFHSPAMQEAAEKFDEYISLKYGQNSPDSFSDLEKTGRRGEFGFRQSRESPAPLSPCGLLQPKGSQYPVFISSLLAQPAYSVDSGYFGRQIASPVRFREASSVMAQRVSLAVEAGPSGALSGLVAQGGQILGLSTLKPGRSALESFLVAASELYQEGFDLDWGKVWEPLPQGRTSLPAYPFQRERFWLEVRHSPPHFPAPKAGMAAAEADEAPRKRHPVLGRLIKSPALGKASVFETVFNEEGPRFLWEHRILGRAVSPAAGHAAMVLAAAEALRGRAVCELKEVSFTQPLVIGPREERLVQVIVDNPQDDLSAFSLVSCGKNASEFVTHAAGFISFAVPEKPKNNPEAVKQRPQTMTVDSYCSAFADYGYGLAPDFWRLSSIFVDGPENYCQVEARRHTPSEAGHVIYPGSLDSVFQTTMPAVINEAVPFMVANNGLFVPLFMESLSLWAQVPEKLFCHGLTKFSASPLGITSSVTAYDRTGEPVLAVRSLYLPLTSQKVFYRRPPLTPAPVFGRDSGTAEDQSPLRFYLEKWQKADLSAAKKVTQLSRETVSCDNLPDLKDRALEVISLGRFLAQGSEAGVLAGRDKSRRNFTGYSAEASSRLTLSADCDIVLLAPAGQTEISAELPFRELALFNECLAYVKVLLKSPYKHRIHLVTARARVVDCIEHPDSGGRNEPVSLQGASLIGLGRTLALERPDLWAGQLDISGDSREDALEIIRRLNNELSGEPYELAFRGGVFYEPFLLNHQAPSGLDLPEALKDHKDNNVQGIQVITGANGALTRKLAEHLVGRGARELALISREGLSGESLQLAEELRARGVTVLDLNADVTVFGELSQALASAREAGAIKGIWHLAGTLADGLIEAMSEERVLKVLGPKIFGAVNLHLATLKDPLDYFTLFSSVAALLGSAGQAGYVSANFFMEAIARYRRLQKLPSAAPEWGPLAGSGMAGSAVRGDNLRRQGFIPLETFEFFRVLDSVLGQKSEDSEVLGVFGAVKMDLEKFFRHPERRRDRRLKSIIPRPAKTGGPGNGSGDRSRRAPGDGVNDGLALALSQLNLAGDRGPVLQELTELAADLLGFAPQDIDPQKPLSDYGFDSLMTVSLRNRLGSALGRSVPVSLAFEHPTVSAMTDWLALNFGPASGEAAGGLGVAGSSESDRQDQPYLPDKTDRPDRFDRTAPPLAPLGGAISVDALMSDIEKLLDNQ